MDNTNAELIELEHETIAQVSVCAADPHGLISSFIRCPPNKKTSPNDIFIVWFLCHRHQTTADAARSVLDTYEELMLRSGSKWVFDLRELFLEIAGRSAPAEIIKTQHG